MSKKKLAIVTSHPVQYNAPWFRLLAQSKDIQPFIFYTWEQSSAGAKYDPGFNQIINWDIPLLEGYEFSFVKNTAADPGTHHFRGIVNPGLIDAIEKWKPYAILVIGWSFQSHLRCIRYFHKKVPIIFRGDSTLLDETSGIKKVLRRFFLKWVYRHIDFALYAGSNNKDYFKVHGLKDSQLVFAPHAVDNNRFAAEEEKYNTEAAKWRKELGFTDNDIVVLFAGKLEPKKDPTIILRLAERLTNTSIKFLLVGNGIQEQELKQLAGSLKNVKFIDFQNQRIMPVIYRLGNIFLLPSIGPGETWGLAVNEAMASGRPIIVSDKVGCARDLIHASENGYIFSAGSITELEQYLLACNDLKKLRAMGLRSLELIQSWNFNNIINAIHSILNK